MSNIGLSGINKETPKRKNKTKKRFIWHYFRYIYLKRKRKRKRKNKIKTKNKNFKFILPKLDKNLTLIVIVLIISFSYILVENQKINYKEKIRIEENLKLEIQKDYLKNCLNTAELNYNSNWNSNCKSLGKKKNCSLPVYRAESIEEWKNKEEKQCMEKFKNKAF